MATLTHRTHCAVHETREPTRNLTADEHHVVPRAWQQLAWAPFPPPHPGTWRDNGKRQDLWDARTTLLAPTCHRNVHRCLVAIMRALAELRAEGDTPADFSTRLDRAIERAEKAIAHFRHPPTWLMAAEAPRRYAEAGGDVYFLTMLGEWGEA